jgi:hypothetical protein
MKTINVAFDDDEFSDLLKDKGDLSWHDYIISRMVVKKAMEVRAK